MAEQAGSAAPAADPVCAASDQENADPADEGSLRKMFAQGQSEIATHRWGPVQCVRGLEHWMPGSSWCIQSDGQGSTGRRWAAAPPLRAAPSARPSIHSPPEAPPPPPHTHTYRTDNLFHNLEQRTLTDEEQRIIEQRVRAARRRGRREGTVSACQHLARAVVGGWDGGVRRPCLPRRRRVLPRAPPTLPMVLHVIAAHPACPAPPRPVLPNPPPAAAAATHVLHPPTD